MRRTRSTIDSVLELMMIIFVAVAAVPARVSTQRGAGAKATSISMMSPHRLGFRASPQASPR